jgi:hypothetical protein
MTTTEDGGTIAVEVIGDLEVVLRCECGETVVAKSEQSLVQEARQHFRAAHPSLGPMPAETIVAMAEKKEKAE